MESIKVHIDICKIGCNLTEMVAALSSDHKTLLVIAFLGNQPLVKRSVVFQRYCKQ